MPPLVSSSGAYLLLSAKTRPPAAYNQIPNSIQLDQLTFYMERQRGLYGLDYRFTTAKGYFSQQLLNNPKPAGTIGNQ